MNKDKTLSFRIPAKEFETYARQAEELDMKISEYARFLMQMATGAGYLQTMSNYTPEQAKYSVKAMITMLDIFRDFIEHKVYKIEEAADQEKHQPGLEAVK